MENMQQVGNQAVIKLASHASVFSGARISSLPTNGACGEGRNKSSAKNACVGGYDKAEQ